MKPRNPEYPPTSVADYHRHTPMFSLNPRALGLTLAILISVLATACGNSGTERGGPTSDRISATPADPCALVFTAAATETLNIGPSRVSHGQSVPRLERLGWAFVARARESRDPGYYTLAGQTAACIARKSPMAPESLLLQGHVLHNLHHFREAEQVARRLVSQRGLWFDYALLGDVLMERGALDEAIDAYQRVLDQRPGPQAYLRAAQVRWLRGDLEGGIDMMQQAVRTTSPRTAEAAAWTRVRLAQWLLQAGQAAKAEAALTGALSLQPGYPPALHAYGFLLLTQDRPQAAVPLLQQAVRTDPQPLFRWSLYEALLEAGRPEAAAAQRSALLQQGALEDARTLALFLSATGNDPQQGLRLAMQELEQRTDVFTLDAVAWALSHAGRHLEALQYSRRALSEGTRDARLFLHAGLVAARADKHSRALALLADAASIQQMLLPSERRQLATEFAALQPQITTPVRVSSLAGSNSFSERKTP